MFAKKSWREKNAAAFPWRRIATASSACSSFLRAFSLFSAQREPSTGYQPPPDKNTQLWFWHKKCGEGKSQKLGHPGWWCSRGQTICLLYDVESKLILEFVTYTKIMWVFFDKNMQYINTQVPGSATIKNVIYSNTSIFLLNAFWLKSCIYSLLLRY